MALSSADRQRRSRAHRKGDHSLCDEGKRDCHDVSQQLTPTVTPIVTPRAGVDGDEDMPELGPGGGRLWRELNAERTLGAADRVLAERACRLVDTLDRMDRIVRGEDFEWMTLRAHLEDRSEVAVVLDRVIGERRQHDMALKAVLGELRMSRQGVAAPSGAGSGSRSGAGGQAATGPPARGGGGGTLLDLQAVFLEKQARYRGAQTQD